MNWPPRTRSSCTGVAGFALAVVLVVAACGGSSVRVASNFPRAIQKLATAKTGVVTTNLVFSGGGHSAPPIVYMTRFDNAQRRIATTIDLRKFIRVYNANSSAAQRVGKPDQWRLDVLADSSRGLVLYISSPLFSNASFQSALPARLRNKKWLKLSFPELARHAAQLGPGLAAQFEAFLPGLGSPVSYFKALSARATPGKTERIDGVETKRYSETVDFRSSLAALPAFFRKIITASSARMKALVWVDGTSQVRRIELTSGAIAAAGGAQVTDTTDFSQLGAKIQVALPPRDQVLDAASLPKR